MPKEWHCSNVSKEANIGLHTASVAEAVADPRQHQPQVRPARRGGTQCHTGAEGLNSHALGCCEALACGETMHRRASPTTSRRDDPEVSGPRHHSSSTAIAVDAGAQALQPASHHRPVQKEWTHALLVPGERPAS